MDVKEAVASAKKYISDLFAQEGVSDLGLEEVEFNEQTGEWGITIGFSRPWERIGGMLAEMVNRHRSFKVVRISDKTGQVLSVRNRETVA